MKLITIYTLHEAARTAVAQQEVLFKLNQLIASVTPEKIVEEIVRLSKNAVKESSDKMLAKIKLEASRSRYAVRVAIVSVQFSAKSGRDAVELMRAHQRLMLEVAHQNELNISVSC